MMDFIITPVLLSLEKLLNANLWIGLLNRKRVKAVKSGQKFNKIGKSNKLHFVIDNSSLSPNQRQEFFHFHMQWM
jgi:hypothetical protein